MSEWKAKRFWKEASAEETDGGFTVRLDGRPVKTPAKAPLTLPTIALARAVAAEWDAQEDEVKPLTMPVTRACNAAIDKVMTQHAEVAAMIASYGENDLLCYRADQPQALCDRQARAWDPLLDWAEAALGARLQPTTGIVHREQEAAALAALRARVAGQDAFALTALHDLVALSGSLVIGLAAQEGAFEPEDLWARSRVDETFQEDQWGTDEEAAEITARKRQEFLQALRFHHLARDSAA